MTDTKNKISSYSLRFSPTEKEKLEENARKFGYVAKSSGNTQIAPYIRDKALMGEQQLLKLESLEDLIFEHIRSRNIGININQIARNLNDYMYEYRHKEGVELPEGIAPEDIQDLQDMLPILAESMESIKIHMAQLFEDIEKLKEDYGILS